MTPSTPVRAFGTPAAAFARPASARRSCRRDDLRGGEGTVIVCIGKRGADVNARIARLVETASPPIPMPMWMTAGIDFPASRSNGATNPPAGSFGEAGRRVKPTGRGHPEPAPAMGGSIKWKAA